MIGNKMIDKIEKIMFTYQELENNDEFAKLAKKAFDEKDEFFKQYPEFKKPFSVACKEQGFMPQFAGVHDDNNSTHFYFFEPYMYYETSSIIPTILKNDILYVSVSRESVIVIEKSFLEKLHKKEMTDLEACKACVSLFLGRAKKDGKKSFLCNFDPNDKNSYRIKFERIFLNEMQEGDSFMVNDKTKTGYVRVGPNSIKGVLYYLTDFNRVTKRNLTSIMAWTPIFE